jgi:hypothetical protein
VSKFSYQKYQIRAFLFKLEKHLEKVPRLVTEPVSRRCIHHITGCQCFDHFLALFTVWAAGADSVDKDLV